MSCKPTGVSARRTKHVQVATAALCLGGVATHGQETPLVIMTAEDPATTWIVQNGEVIDEWGHFERDVILAVRETIRALRFDSRGVGHEYEMDGTFTGVTYAPPPVNGQLIDGAASTDHNYTAEFGGSGTVWQFDSAWEGQRALFATGEDYIGIAYDMSDDTLWLSIDGQGIRNVTLTGETLFEFNPGAGRWGSLAYEQATDTLWMIDNQTSEMRQYDTSGNMLLSQGVVDFGNIFNAEFPVQARLSCPWDLNADNLVGTTDLLLLLGSWGDPYGTADLIELLGNWGPCPK